jgi:hypothetical protein
MVGKVITFFTPPSSFTRLLAELNIIRYSSRPIPVRVSEVGKEGDEKVHVN